MRGIFGGLKFAERREKALISSTLFPVSSFALVSVTSEIT
jgi:hypothetical protein